MRTLKGFWLGRRDYGATWELQSELLLARRRQEIEDVVLFLEHPPVITMGKGAHSSHLLASAEALSNLGIGLHRVDRGGDVTLHAPGQLVCYPIVDLSPSQKDVRKYVRALTSTMGAIVGEHGIQAGELADHVGLWTDRSTMRWNAAQQNNPTKLGAIGVRISKWVTMHGFALNLTTDLSLFRFIIPCGITSYSVDSVKSLVGSAPEPEHATPMALEHLGSRLDRQALGPIDLEETAEGELLAQIILRSRKSPTQAE